jgi:hypothetical protein
MRRPEPAYSSVSVMKAHSPSGRSRIEALAQRRDAERDLRVGRCEAVESFDRRRLQVVFGEILRQRLAAAVRLGADQHAALPRVRGEQERAQVRQRIVEAAVDGDIRQRLGEFAGAGFLAVAGDDQAAERLGEREEVLGAEKQLGGRQQRAFAVGLQEAVARLGVAQKRRIASSIGPTSAKLVSAGR